MPYVLVSTQIRLETGPTVVGDRDSDPVLMASLEATPRQQLGCSFVEYATQLTPRAVLDRLDDAGWKLVGQAGIGQTVTWTMYKLPKKSDDEKA